MKYSKTLLASALLASSSLAQAVDLSANLGVQSNYLFRGVTQTDDKAAVSGGLDLTTDSPFYLGAWMSNVDFGGDESVEVDLYGGIGDDIGDTGFSYDLSGWYYWYPGDGDDDLDYAEVSGSLGWKILTGSISYTVYSETNGDHAFDNDDLYYNLNIDFPWDFQGFTASANIGYYDFDDDGNCMECDFNYTNWGISVTKDAGDFGSLSMNYEQVSDENDVSSKDDPQFWIGWARGF